jgi:cobalamin-dependent methionine synthase I
LINPETEGGSYKRWIISKRVGENINTSRKRIAEAVEKQDAAFIGQVAKNQADAGADFIDVNAGTFVDRETEYLCWLVKTVQDAVGFPPPALDGAKARAIAERVAGFKDA